MYQKILVFCLLLAAMIISGCSSVKEITLAKPESDIQIDGNDAEWETGLMQQDNTLIGLRNDESYLYCLFVTGDRSKMRRIMMGGLNIKMENTANGNVIGIKYPTGMGPGGMEKMRREEQGNELPSREREPESMRPPEPSMNISILDKSGNQVSEILNGDANGIVAAFSADWPRFVYEIRIPLEGFGSGYTAPARAGNEMLLTFESGNMERKKNQRIQDRPEGGDEGASMGQGRDQSGAGRPGGHPGEGPRGGRQVEGGRTRPNTEDKAFEIKFKVTLNK